MRTPKTLPWALALVSLGLAVPAPASAESLRVVVLAKVLHDDKAADPASLESLAISALREKDARVVELSAALAAQKAALSDAVAEGKVPAELSALNADLALSVQLACTKGAEKFGTGIFAFRCTLTTKAVRVDSGDVASASNADFGPDAVNAADAVRFVLAKKGAAELKAQAEKLAAAPASLSLDLTVSGLADRDRASALAERLSRAPGVKSARLAVFGRALAKFTLELAGAGARGALLDALGKDAEAPLKITYETERLVHAAYDFDRANLRPVAVFWTVAAGAPKSKAADVRELASPILGAALRNLGYFQVGAVSPLPAKLEKKDAKAALAELAKADGGSLALLCRISASGAGWLATLELGAPKATGVLASAAATAPEPLDAVDQAVRKLDQAWRDALGKPATRALLSIRAPSGPPEALAVEAFEAGQVFPALLPRYQKEGVGKLVLKNRSAEPVTGGRVRFALGATILSDAPLADLAPGASVSLPVRLDALPSDASKDRFRQLSASITFKAGESYGKTDAYAPLVLQDPGAIDWSEPRSLAAFVDAADASVRTLASKALGEKREGGIAPASRDAAQVFEALWRAPLKYVADPVRIAFSSEVDSVQGPAQTLARLAGDCDDLTVLLASLLESVGLSTAILIVPGHVLPAVDAGTLAGGHVLYGLPRSAFVEVDGALFIPLEATAIGSGFAEAWLAGAKAVRGAQGKVQAFRTRSAWRSFPTVPIASADPARLEAGQVGEQAWLKILSAVAAGTKESVPAWSTELSQKLLAPAAATEPVVLKSAVPASETLAPAALSYLAAATDRGMPTAAQACTKGSAEACYNLAVMFSLDDVEGAAEMKASLAEAALGSLPPAVAGMLVDVGSALGADETSEEAAAKRRLNELLKTVQKHADEQRAKRAWSGKVEQLATAGRRGAKVEPKSAALLFFWGPVAKQ